MINGFQLQRECQRKRDIFWFRLRIIRCRILQDTKKMTKVVRSIREMMKNHIQAMEFL